MAAPELFTGCLVPQLTPFKPDLTIDTERFIAFSRWLLDEGADGLAIFGTTSEANSLSMSERMETLDKVVDAGIPASTLMPGTGMCALPDAVTLTTHAVKAGAGGCLVLPQFYYKSVTDDGIYDYFARLIHAVADENLRVYLYHFPQMATHGFSLSLIERLLKDFPGTVVGLKDSSGDWENTKVMQAEFPGFAVFPSSEARIPEGIELGMAGTISGTANIQPRAIRQLIEALGTANAPSVEDKVTAVRKVFEGFPLITAHKAVVARDTGDPDWSICRPPLVPLGHDKAVELFAALDATGAHRPVLS